MIQARQVKIVEVGPRDGYLLGRATQPGKVAKARTYQLMPGMAYLYGEGDLQVTDCNHRLCCIA